MMKVPFEATLRGELEVPDHMVDHPDLSRWLQDKVECGLLPYCRPVAMFDVRPPSTFRVLNLSTKHVAESDVKWLSEPGQYLLTNEFEHGWFILVDRDEPNWLNNNRLEGVPASILAILQYALDHQCDYILLNGVGPVNAALPEYNW